MITYQATPGVEVRTVGKRPVFKTPQGGEIATDRILEKLWRIASGRTLEEILLAFRGNTGAETSTGIALACLTEAGLLTREGIGENVISKTTGASTGESVSVIIVNFYSLDWLKKSLPSLAAQTYRPAEIIVVDNGSADGAGEWIQEHHPGVRVVSLDSTTGFAAAINQGVAVAQGAHFLMLNPDVELEPGAIAELVAVMESDPSCAVAAAKLRFWWAPAFINGIGNRVGPISWGTDNGLGDLDIGQFDSWQELPSACFAGALVRRAAWEDIGALDEGFPMYYEDTEWSYRARSLGYRVLAAPRAVIYHAIGSQLHAVGTSDLLGSKLSNVVYGRLRFALKLLGRTTLARFLVSYSFEDICRIGINLLRGKTQLAGAVLGGWNRFKAEWKEIMRLRKELQPRRRINDRALFALNRNMPEVHIWRGVPELTWDLVEHYYAPLIKSGRTRPLPEMEFTRLHSEGLSTNVRASWTRAIARWVDLWRKEGGRIFIHRFWRYLQWKISQ